MRDISKDTKLDNCAAVLSVDQWEDLHGDDVLYLNAEKVAQAHKKGFVKRNGIWQPENTVVGEVWDHLSRGKDLKEYAEMVYGDSSNDRVLRLFFDRNNYNSPVMRFLVVYGIDSSSLLLDFNLIAYSGCRLAGVAPVSGVSLK